MKADLETRTRTGSTAELDGGAVLLRNPGGQAQAETGAAPLFRPVSADTVETFEDTVVLVLRYANARVFDGEDHFASGLRSDDKDGSAWWSEFAGVVQQNAQKAKKGRAIGCNPERIAGGCLFRAQAFRLQREHEMFCHGSPFLMHGLNQLPQIHGGEFERF